MEPINVASDNFTVDKYNNVYVNGVATHKVAIADFADYASLKKAGDNYYTGENPTYAEMQLLIKDFWNHLMLILQMKW